MLLKRKDLIDIVVPRGGEKLIDFVQRTALMPIIKNDRGLCHAYVDDEADLQMAVKIVDNAKTQRPGVCNSLETVLVHKAVAERFLPLLYQATEKVGLQWRVDAASEAILKGKSRIQRATEEDWNTEHLDQILNCRVVESFEQAFEHIDRYGSKHSETIITANEGKARQFQEDIDAAAVYWNASTRFTDGFEFGLGGELGISTQKLHVRGPVGLRELTTPRWIIDGHGQIR
jgi:glutamate-5-semialdehyde dehydrogenase